MRSARRLGGFFVFAFLAWSLVIAPAASASLVAKTTETVRSTVEAVQGVLERPPATNAPPSVPNAPSATPPVAPPAPPAVPPKRSSPGPSSSAPSIPSQPPSSAGGETSATGGVVGVVKDRADSVTGAIGQVVKQAPAPVDSDAGGPVSSLQGKGPHIRQESSRDGGAAAAARSGALDNAPGAAEASARRTGRATDIAPAGALALAMAQVVDLERWLARVWPAIALGVEADRTPAVTALGASLLEPPASTLGEVVFAAASATAVADGSTLGVSSESAKARYSELLGMMSSDWKKVLYRIALAVLLALLAFTVWKEFRPALRPRVR